MTDRLTNLRIKRNNVEIFNKESGDNDKDLIQLGFKAVPNTFVFSPVASRFGVYDALETAGTKLEIMPTVTAPGDIPFVIETMENVADEMQSPMAALTA